MKTYNITVDYEQPDRDMYGFPQFGTKSVEIIAIDQPNAERRLDEIFGKRNYNIINVIETLDTRL